MKINIVEISKNKDFDLFISDIFEIFWDLATQKEYHDMIQKKLSDRNIRVENESGGVCRYVGNGKKIFKTNV